MVPSDLRTYTSADLVGKSIHKSMIFWLGDNKREEWDWELEEPSK